MYEKTIKLNHNEVAAKVNTETGEVSTINQRPNNIPQGQERFSYDESFHKAYERSWLYLAKELSGVELKMALMMSCMTEYATNSLAPLDNKTSYDMLSERFKISKGSIGKVLNKLFEVGVYASFKYSHYRRGTVEEWVFNPFISFKGKLINSDLKNLFINTKVAKQFLNGDDM